MSRPRITLIGNGFASLFFLSYLARPRFRPPGSRWLGGLFDRYDITLIGNGRFVYFPAIPELITGRKRAADIIVDVRSFLRRRRVRFLETRALDILDGGRKVVTDRGEVENDALFVGTGPEFRTDDIPGTEEHTFSPCCGPEQMETFLEHLGRLDSGVIYVGFKLNKRDGFVAGRGGQMYECATLLHQALKQRGLRERFEIHLFSPDLEPGETGMITDALRARDIVLDYGYEPRAFVEGGMIDADGGFRRADLVLFTPGIRAPQWVRDSCLPVTPGGHIDVDRFGQVRGLERVFAAGDCAGHENPPAWVPHQAHMAQLRAEAAAHNLRAVLAGRTPTRTYRHELSCILNMHDDALWLHVASDGSQPFGGIFPKHSKRLISVKDTFERLFLFYLRHL